MAKSPRSKPLLADDKPLRSRAESREILPSRDFLSIQCLTASSPVSRSSLALPGEFLSLDTEQKCVLSAGQELAQFLLRIAF